MTTPPPPHAPAGWYPDPSGGAQRYWDGSAWLDLVPPPPLEVKPLLPEPMPRLPPPIEPPAPQKKTTANAKCFNCNHTQAVPSGVLSYTCEECGTKLKRHPRSKDAPAQLDTANAPQDSDDEELDNPPWLQMGVPAGLLVLALIFAVIAGVFNKGAFAIPTFVCLGAGVFWFIKTRDDRITAPVALSTTPQPDQVRQHQFGVLHLLISIFLCGLWLPVWLVIGLSGGEKRTVISVDHCGNVTTAR